MLIRPGKPQDIQTVSDIYVGSWRTTYEGLAPEAFVRGITLDSAADIFRASLGNRPYCYFLLVAEAPEGRIVGFADGGRERSLADPNAGELYGLYLLKEFQGQGIGRALFQSVVKRLVESGMDSMKAWIMENSPHRAFYEKLGGFLEKGAKTLAWEGQNVSLICYRWDHLKKLIF